MKLTINLMKIGFIRRLVKSHFFQFFFTLAAIAIIFKDKHQGINFGILMFLFVVVSLGWCVTCPFSALGERVQGLSSLMGEGAVIMEGDGGTGRGISPLVAKVM